MEVVFIRNSSVGVVSVKSYSVSGISYYSSVLYGVISASEKVEHTGSSGFRVKNLYVSSAVYIKGEVRASAVLCVNY